MKLKLATIAAMTLLSGMAHAGAMDGLTASATVGTLGAGIDLSKSVTSSMDARIGFNAASYDRSITKSRVDYQTDASLETFHVLADWRPRGNGFRVTGGLMYNNNKVTLNAMPASDSTFNLNGVTYNAKDIGSLNGELSFNRLDPYIGIGYNSTASNKSKKWGVVADLGVMYHGSPKVQLSATCGAGTPSAVCAEIQSSTAAERDDLRAVVDDMRWYPVASVGLAYRY